MFIIRTIITKTIAVVTMFAVLLTFAIPVTISATAEAKAAPKLSKKKITLTITEDDTKPICKLKVKNVSKKVKWTSTNKTVATVNQKGKVTAKQEGNAMIVAKTGKQTLRCKVKVKDIRDTEISDEAEDEATDETEDEITDKTITQKCDHVYEDNWTAFDKYYETGPHMADTICCSCGMYKDEQSFRRHLFFVNTIHATFADDEDDYESFMGPHGKNAKWSILKVTINGKEYEHLHTEYVDKRTCVKCGETEESMDDGWETQEKMNWAASSYNYIMPVDPYASANP